MRFKSLMSFTSPASAAGTTVAAQPTLPANTDPAAVTAGRYAVEPSHTRLQFSLSHMGFTHWYGDLTGASGTLVLDPKDPAAAKLDVTLPVASVATTNAKLDGNCAARNGSTRTPIRRSVSRRRGWCATVRERPR